MRLPRRSSRAVFALVLVFAISGALIARSTVHDEESRLLAERASEVSAQLTSNLTAAETSMRSLGTLATLPGGLRAFDAAGASLIVGPVRALALIEPQGSGFVARTVIGDGWQPTSALSGERNALVRRAQLGPQIVSAVIQDNYRRRLAFALSLPPDLGGEIVYQEDAIDTSNPIATPVVAPSSQIEISFYASASPRLDSLVLASDWPRVQTSGHITHVTFGADQWTLVVRSVRPLTGPFAPLVPWLLLAGGVVSAFLAAGIVQVLARRRDFALALVAERTIDLRNSVESLQHAQAELRHHAFHDGLTGLPNRVLLMDRIDQALRRTERPKSGVALLFMDIDRFKWVNDSLGHSAGDDLLVAVADRLRSALRPADTVARLGGDEFVVLCEDIQSESEAAALAQRTAERVCDSIQIGGHQIQLTTSIGVALATPELTAHELLRDGDIAMYQAKDRGRDRIEIFDRAMRSRAASRLPAEVALRTALDNAQIGVHYQPVVSPKDGAVVGVEALARWTDSTGVVHAPSSFIEVAEETGLIVPLGITVLEQACGQVGQWNREHPDRRPLSVSVNLSAKQLEAPGLIDMIRRVLSSSGLSNQDLWLEITETVLMEERGACLAAMDSLSELGVTVVVDDFGTGYSSLLYLHRLPVDVLKIDQSFVAGMGRRHADDAIVTSVLNLAHDLGMIAVAEGVETASQADGLARLGCDLAQGFHWCRPKNPAELIPWLERWWPFADDSNECDLEGRLIAERSHAG